MCFLCVFFVVGVHSLYQQKIAPFEVHTAKGKKKKHKKWHEKFNLFSIPVLRSSNNNNKTETSGHTSTNGANQAEAEKAIFQSSLWQFT